MSSRAVFLDPPPDDQIPVPSYAGPAWTPSSSPSPRSSAAWRCLEIVLLAGPAFAVGARRRQRQLALVAANGGTPAHIRRIVLADGVVLGVVGAVSAWSLGIAVAVRRPAAASRSSSSTPGPAATGCSRSALAVIAGLAVVTGLLAALVPAFIVAPPERRRVAGRPARHHPVHASGGWSLGLRHGRRRRGRHGWRGRAGVDTTVILAGLVLGELGLVLCTPAFVGLIARLGRLLPLAPRIALRDAARNRTAAAPAISAVMAAVAGSVAIGVVLVGASERSRDSYRVLGRPGDVFVLSFGRTVPPESGRRPARHHARVPGRSTGSTCRHVAAVAPNRASSRGGYQQLAPARTTSWGATRPPPSSAPRGATRAATVLATATNTSGMGPPAA